MPLILRQSFRKESSECIECELFELDHLGVTESKYDPLVSYHIDLSIMQITRMG